jgi:hypothetical protein
MGTWSLGAANSGAPANIPMVPHEASHASRAGRMA